MSKKERSEWFGAIDHLNLDSDTSAPTSKVSKENAIKTPSISNKLMDSKAESIPETKTSLSAPKVNEQNTQELKPKVNSVKPTQNSKKTKKKKQVPETKEHADQKPAYITARVREDLYKAILIANPKLNNTEAMEVAMLYYLKCNKDKMQQAIGNLNRMLNAY